jgi:hypothetical protein
MSKELRIDFQGVAAFVPDLAFAQEPTRMDVVLRNLLEPQLILDAKGTPRLVGAHQAWLEFPPGDRVKGSADPKGIAEVINGWTGTILGVLLLDHQYISIQRDGKSLPAEKITIADDVLLHLAVYKGILKTAYKPNKTGSDEVAAAFPLSGGTLSVVETTDEPYDVPLHDGKTVQTQVATTLRWTIPFEEEVTLRFVGKPKSKILRLRPQTDILQISVRNRELVQLLSDLVPAKGGKDDPEFLVYGDSIVGGQPQVLTSSNGAIPSGHKACGTGGIQP